MLQKKRNMHWPLLAFITLGLSGCSGLTGNSLGGALDVSLNVKRVVLDNGLTVLIAPNPKLPIASYYTLFDVGGRYESSGTTGATHFLEHMMFKGAKKYGPGEFDVLIEKNGGATNAYTTNDATVYYQSIPSSFVEKMVDLEADRLQHLLLEPTSFESERQVIFEERKMRYENNPDGFLYLMTMKKMFEGTPYGQSVIGDVEDLSALSRDQVMDFFKTYYAPDNAILAIAGDVDPEKLIPLIKEKYGSIAKSKNLNAIKSKRDDPKNYEWKSKLKEDYRYYATNPNPKFSLAFRGEKIGTRKAFVLDVLSLMLSSGGSSYLSQKYVRNAHPLLSEISLSSYNLRHSGIFYFNGELMDGVDIEKFKKQFSTDLLSFCSEGLNSRTLQKIKNQIMAQAYTQMKTNAGMASTIMMNEKVYGDYAFGVKELEIYNSVTESEVKEACQDVLHKSPSQFISVWDKFPKIPVAKMETK
ncbi:MAG: insulinase family protein [Bacteriovorax sp.]|nr:insulinase family protein [Bacteriovorax sp.]